MLTTHWTFIPESNIDPNPSAFEVLDKNGGVLPMEVLIGTAQTEFSKFQAIV